MSCVENKPLLSDIPSVLLTNLSLRHCIPTFEKNKINIFRFLNMTDPLEFSSIGLSPLDSHKLALFVKAFQDSRRDGPYSPKSTRRSFSSSTSSQYSSSESGSRSSTQTILPENDWFKDIHETSHFLDAYDGQGGKQDLLRAVNELEYMITDPQTKHPAITVTSERKSSKSSTRLSDISMFSTTTMVALPEESNETNETCEYVDDHKQNTRVIQNMQPLPLNSPPPYETNTPIKPTLLSPTYPRHEGQSGMAIPRPRKQLTSNVSRPVSMPSYLFPQARIPSLNRTQYNTLSLPPPPDYLESTLGTWGRSKGPILPREEEGREELPPYKCTVYKIGYVNIKFEKDSPSTKSRWRLWRNLYVELWGTALRIYRSEPSDSASGLRLSRLPVLVPWNRYNSTPLLTLSLAGAEASRALDYTKKPNVLRLTVSNGPQLLFKQDTTIEMISWIEHLQAAINISLDLEHRPMPKFVTLYVRGSNEPTLAARTIELERAREVRRNAQEEVLI
ncbi:hypothetical protein CLU79DRAFT_758952 [Phycomyces nitens]|nr:hypothetical protein CLU79DRAFT_758952 [Phycomyces nitens]